LSPKFLEAQEFSKEDKNLENSKHRRGEVQITDLREQNKAEEFHLNLKSWAIKTFPEKKAETKRVWSKSSQNTLAKPIFCDHVEALRDPLNLQIKSITIYVKEYISGIKVNHAIKGKILLENQKIWVLNWFTYFYEKLYFLKISR
jgi:hypothetical protein